MCGEEHNLISLSSRPSLIDIIHQQHMNEWKQHKKLTGKAKLAGSIKDFITGIRFCWENE